MPGPSRSALALLGLSLAGSAQAHGAAGGVVLLLFGGGLGLLAGIVAAIYIASRPGPAGSKAASIGAALLGLPVLGYMVTYTVLDAPRRARNAAYAENEARYQSSALRRVVCDHDPVGLRREFANDGDTSRLARALRDCAFDDGNAKQQEIFSSGMQLLASAPVRDRASGGPMPTDYCSLLETLHNSPQAAGLVRKVHGLGLPVSCLDHLGQPIWWTGIDRQSGDAAWAWWQALRESRVDFGERAQRTGETALDRVVRCHEPRVVRWVLDAAPAVDPRRVSGPAGQRPPTAWWALRRFKHPKEICRLTQAPPEQFADAAVVDARMGELTAEMINQAITPASDRAQFVEGTMLWHLFGPAPDAELFAHLMAKGGDLQVRDRRGESFLYGLDPGPDFLAVLARVPDEQIRRLSEAAPGLNGDVSKPLVLHAREAKRAALIEFLCARGAQGC